MDREFLEAFAKLSKLINIIINDIIPQNYQAFTKPLQQQFVGYLWLNPEKTKKLYKIVEAIVEEE